MERLLYNEIATRCASVFPTDIEIARLFIELAKLK